MLVRDVHHAAVGPDAARAVVACLREEELPEVLLFDALEPDRPGLPRHGQAVGEEAFGSIVGDPDCHAVGPDSARVVVCEIESVLGPEIAAPEIVGEEGRALAVHDPHGLVVGPETVRVAVPHVENNVAVLGALPTREVVGVEPVPVVVGDPGRLAVGREAARGAVPLIEIEFRPLPAFAAREVVGIDAAVGVRAGLGDPEGRAVGPQSRGHSLWASSSSRSCSTVHSKSTPLGGRDGPSDRERDGSVTVIVTLMLAVAPEVSVAVTVAL